MEENRDFEIDVHGVPGCSEEDWRRAQNAPLSELPPLAGEDFAGARRLQMPPDEGWQRSKLATAYGEQRLKAKGETLGKRVVEILRGLGPGYRLVKVETECSKDYWVLRVETERHKTAFVKVPSDLADDVLDFGAPQDKDRLRNLVLFGAGRQELIFKH